MPIYNADIADIFDEIADYLEIEGENPFRIRAYRNAARSVRGLGPELKDMVAQKEDLTRLPGIGKELAAKIVEIVKTGTARALKKLQDKIPAEVRLMLKIPKLGPKRVRNLYQDLNIQSLEQLLQAAKDGRIRSMPGFGQKMETQILKAVEAHAEKEIRFKIAAVKPYVDSLLNYLEKVAGVQQVVAAGSFRRSKETLGDLDILVVADSDSPVMDRFVDYEDVADVLSRGTTRSSIVLRSGLQVDLRMVAAESFGAALQYFTGSQAHNVAVRRLGRQRGLKINEYGVFKFEERVAGQTEESIYQSVGLAYIPPELRENRGEIEAARDKCLPRLIELRDLKGDLHTHTNWSDGRNTLEEMIQAAQKRGLKYLAITEHSDRLKVAGGLGAARLLEQIERIDRFNEEHTEIILLKGIEVEILEDGSLDLSDDILGRLDLVVGSIHSFLGLPLHKQTERIMRAMDHRYFSILAHPSNRLIDERPPIEVEMIQVIQMAKERGCFLELNSNPKRLDLYDTYCQIAKDEGVLVSIASDAHSVNSFDHLRYGVGQARRGWLEKDDVVNTRPLGELRKLLRQTMG
ncbi:MAG: DNA polymerase/3'-5' exonuclease PolX [Deltaproteobacteria bacterium]|nr:DNA polymerase/3'-5' exonuclease PolX [Deltaproteobacteria bacterium]